MKALSITSMVAATILLASPGHAEPGAVEAGAVEVSAAETTGETTAFLASLRRAGIGFADPEQAVAAGHAVCGLAANGETGLELLTDLRNANPALTISGAAQFAAIAAQAYCPHQLAPAGKSAN